MVGGGQEKGREIIKGVGAVVWARDGGVGTQGRWKRR